MPGLDEFLRQTRTEENVVGAEPATPAGTPSPLDSFLARQDETTKLKLAVDAGAAKDAQRAARIVRLQTRTGLPPDFLDRNLESVETTAAAQGFDPEQYRKDNPAVASWLSEHPDHAAVAAGDYHQLGYIEKLWNALSLSVLGVRQSKAAYLLQQNVGVLEHIAATERLGISQVSPERALAYKKDVQRNLAAAVSSITALQARQQRIPMDPVVMEALNATSFADFWHWFTQKPFEFTMMAGAISLPAMAPGISLAIPLGVAGGVSGAAAGIGLGSFTVDYASQILQAMQMEGVDLSNPEAVWKATHDQALMGRVGASAFRHAIPVALLDVASGGVAGKTLGPTARLAGRPIVRQAVNVALQAPTQGILGATGEAIGEVAAGQPIQPGQIMAEFFGEFAMAPAEVGAVTYAAGKHAYREAAAARERQAYFEALGTGVTDSKTFQRLPEAIQEIVARATKDGPIETLYVPVEAFRSYFQKEGVDPREAMQALTGDAATYDLAAQSGGDVPIPTAVYAAQIAPTPANAFFAREVRTSPEAMNGREAEEWYAARVAETKKAAAEQAAAQRAEAVMGVGQQITGQLIASGFDPAVAEQYAALFEARYGARAERRGLGETPLSLFEAQNLHVQRVLPDVLTRMQGTTELDVLLDRLRSGETLQPGRLYGQSLMEMLREAGGVQDQGGELSAMDVDAVLKPFQRKLINPEGLTLERATERAVEGGYLAEQDINAFLELLAQEARGQPAYAVGKEDVGLVGVQQKMEMLAHELAQRNLDVQQLTNEEIKQALGEAVPARQAAVGPTFEQRIAQMSVPELLQQIAFELHQVSGIVQVGKTEQPTRTERLHASEVYRQALERLRTMPPTDPLKAALAEQTGQLREALKMAGSPPPIFLAGVPLFQGGPESVKGSITFGKGRIDVRLLEKADLSTFIHETGHLYLDELITDAATAGTPQQLRDDVDTVLKWMGVEVRVADGEQAVRAAVQPAQHEQFARGFEAYALEGKAPSLALREVFARFRQWLIQVYRLLTFQGGASVDNIAQVRDVKLTNAVREVMDRMLATESEIAAAEQEAEIVPLFMKAEDAGMTEQEFALYRETIARASLTARETLQAKMMQQYRREQEAWWKAERETMKAQVAAEVNAQPAYIALAVMQKGVMPDGSALPDGVRPVKLDKQALVDQFGADFLKRLPRGIRASPGVSPDSAAVQFGFQSGEALVMAVVNARPKAQLIEAETDLRMKHEHGDMRFDGTGAEIARAAVANEEREKVIAAELAALRRKQLQLAPFVKEAASQATVAAEQAAGTEMVAGAERAAKAAMQASRLGAREALAQVPPVEWMERVARERIASHVVRSIRPYEYWVAARRASREASAALGKGDMGVAIKGKQQELLNLALFREASAAKEETQAIYEHMADLRKKPAQERLGKAGADYRDQVNAILARYEFSNVPMRVVESRASLAEWVAEKEANGETLGEEFFVPAAVLAEARRVNYKDVTYGELLGVRDTVKQIEHFARLKNKLLKAQGTREKEALRESLIATLEMNVRDKGPAPLTIATKTTMEKASALAQAFDASLIKMEQVVEWLDGGPTGPWHDAFWNPAADAQAAEYDYTEKITAKIMAAIMAMPADIRTRMLDTVKIDGIERPVARKELLGVALNVGNQSNHDKLLKGMGWSEAQLVQMLDHLTEAEWTFVQSIWDTLEGMWPDVAALQKRLSGIEPEKVVTRPVVTKFGTFRGGYYPVMYDPILAKQGELQLSDTIGSLSNNSRATMQSGYRKERVQGFARPFNLDVDHLPSHLAGVVKDLTHREWMIDARWITDDAAIRKALQRHLGDAGTRRMGEWVSQTVNDRNSASMASMQVWEKMIEGFRYNVMIVMMGFKFSTMFSQLAGVAPAIEVIGGKELDGAQWFAKGLGTMLRQPRSAYDWMVAQSGEMRHRIQTRDRDMRDKLRQLEGHSDLWSQIQSASLQAIGWSELMISAPSWYGAYYKAIDAGMSDEEAVRMGDRAVRLGQGASGAKDLSAVMARSNQLMKVLTMFYTPFSAMYGRLRAIGHDLDGLRDVPQMAVRLFLTIVVAGTIGAIASGQGPEKKKDQTWLDWWLKNVALYPFLAIPMMRDAMTSIVQGYSYQFTPLAKVWETRIGAARDLEKTLEGEKEWADYIEKAYKAFEFLVGLPTEQLLITGKYLCDLYTGNAHPDNIFQFMHDLFYRRPKEG